MNLRRKCALLRKVRAMREKMQDTGGKIRQAYHSQKVPEIEAGLENIWQSRKTRRWGICSEAGDLTLSLVVLT